jgi:hypothetical protein
MYSNFSLWVVILLTSLAATPSEVTACTKDTDCKGDRICVQSECSAPNISPKSAVSTPSTNLGDESDDESSDDESSDDESSDDESSDESEGSSEPHKDDSRTSFHTNLLGLLLFGLTPSLEMGGAQTVLIRSRILNTGYLPYLLAEGEDTIFNFGLGVGLQLRKYFGTARQRGPYFGAGMEVIYTKTTLDSENNPEEYKTYSLVPQIELGFRWDFPGYLLGVGAFLGAQIPVKATGHDLEDSDTMVAAGLIVDLGWYL